MGNPNVGKSVVFSRLTGAHVITSNYPGTTVDFSRGVMRIDEERIELIDAPGTYSLTPSNKAEEVALQVLNEADMVINVVDATSLERNLHLSLELLEREIPIIIALNLWDETQHLGININVKTLEDILGVPVVPTVALTAEGIKTLVDRIPEAKISNRVQKMNDDERWITIGTIIKKVEHVEHRHHTFQDRISDMTIKPLTGLPIAMIILLLSFWFVRIIGEGISNIIKRYLFEDIYKPLINSLGDWLGDGIWYKILISQSFGDISFEGSLGVLTTGIYVPLAMVLPYIIVFYFLLSLFEDSGYLPRLSTLVDTVFHRLGMHGYGIVPLFLGFGCNVPGALALRNMETKKQRFIAATLLSISVPCMAQTAMIFGILGPFGTPYIILVFLTLAIVYVSMGLILNRFMKGESPEIFLEIPAYRRPSFHASLKKTWMRVQWFLKDAIPYLFIGVLIINILYTIEILQWIGDVVAPIMQWVFGIPGETSVALISGLFRKDLAVGMLLPLGLEPLQLVIVTTMLTIYFPCLATFAVLLKELGIRDMIKATMIMGITAITVGIVLRIVFLGVPS